MVLGPELSPRSEKIKASTAFFTAAKNRFKENASLEDVLDVLSQATALGAELMEEDPDTGKNVVFRAQALEQAFALRRQGAQQSDIDACFTDFDLSPEQI